MPIKIEEYGGVWVLSIHGEFSGQEVVAARNAVTDLLEQRRSADFVVDLEKVPFVDSEGLELLLWMKRRCEDLVGQFKLARVDESVKKILEMTRLGRRFEISPDVPTALRLMR